MSFEITITVNDKPEVVKGSHQELAHNLADRYYHTHNSDERWKASFCAFFQMLNVWVTGNQFVRLQEATRATIDTALYEYTGSDRSELERAGWDIFNTFVEENRPAPKPKPRPDVKPVQGGTELATPATTQAAPPRRPSERPVRRVAHRDAGPANSATPATEVRSETAPAGTQPGGQKPQGKGGPLRKVRAAFSKN